MEDRNATLNVGKKIKGIQIKKLSAIIAIATTVISVFLLIGLYFSFVNYKSVLKTSNDYVEWQQTAHKMRETSDYLTEEVRDFVESETFDRTYLDNYFHEAENDKNRDKALEYIQANFPNSDLYASLKKAFDGSVKLMETEYLAMRLKIESAGGDLTEYPQQVQNAPLTVPDKYDYSGKTPEEKGELARHILFDKAYMDAKEQITGDTNDCTNQLIKELNAKQKDAEGKMRVAFTFEVVMIMAFIGYSVFVIVITSRQVFRPIMRSIPLIQSDSPMLVEGAHELRVLANTYNTLYNAHHKETSSLKFKTEHDTLTGALNRRALDKLQAAADDGKVAFLIVDVDNFKQVNDSYGHLVGDKILQKVVAYLRLHLRSDDRIFRIGGDEFAVVMFGVDSKAKNIIRQKVDAINKTLSEEKSESLPPISLSVGVAFGSVIDQHLIANADNALYKRKQSGKAGVTFHE